MVTAVVTCCRRPHNLERIWQAVRAQSHPIDSIWLFYNGKDDLPEDLPRFDRSVRGSDADDYHTRFAIALVAPTEFVWILDDDCVPGPRWVEHCLAAARERDGIFAPAGFRVTRPRFATRSYAHAGKIGVGVRSDPHAFTEVDVPYHAYLLRRRHLAWMFLEPLGVGLRDGVEVRVRSHEDILLACRAWRHAGVRCWVPSRPEPETAGADEEVDEVEYASWANDSSFGEDRLGVLRYEASLGWKPLIARRRRWLRRRRR